MVKVFQTVAGQRFLERDVPNIVNALNKISLELTRANDLKEIELKLKQAEIDILAEMTKGGNK